MDKGVLSSFSPFFDCFPKLKKENEFNGDQYKMYYDDYSDYDDDFSVPRYGVIIHVNRGRQEQTKTSPSRKNGNIKKKQQAQPPKKKAVSNETENPFNLKIRKELQTYFSEKCRRVIQQAVCKKNEYKAFISSTTRKIDQKKSALLRFDFYSNRLYIKSGLTKGAIHFRPVFIESDNKIIAVNIVKTYVISFTPDDTDSIVIDYYKKPVDTSIPGYTKPSEAREESRKQIILVTIGRLKKTLDVFTFSELKHICSYYSSFTQDI